MHACTHYFNKLYEQITSSPQFKRIVKGIKNLGQGRTTQVIKCFLLVFNSLYFIRKYYNIYYT